MVLIGLMVACGGDDGGDRTSGAAGGASNGGADVTGTVQVFAAASLTDAFEDVAAAFEDSHPNVDVSFSFAGSSALVQQLLDGAPADVLATADERTMGQLVDDAPGSLLQGEPEVFARNRLALVVPAGNPADLAGLDDLADNDLFVGLCATEVPCGNVAAEVLEDEGITPAVDSYEPDVRSLLTKLVAGELDAGLVYQTDAQAAGDDIEVIEVPELGARTTSYPVVALDAGDNPVGGAVFADYVRSDEAQRILSDYGFAAP